MKIRTALIMVTFISLLIPAVYSKTDDSKPVFQNFVLEDLAGNKVDLYKEYKDKGKVIILDLFATWCGPCRMEIPGFIELQRQYTNDLVMIGISFDQQDPVPTLKSFITKMGINYRVLLGSQELSDYTALRGIPRTFILGPDFSVHKDVLGMKTRYSFMSNIDAVKKDMEKGEKTKKK